MPCSQKSSPRVSGFPTLPPPASARLEGLQALGGAGPGRPGHCSQTGGPHGGKQQTNKQINSSACARTLQRGRSHFSWKCPTLKNENPRALLLHFYFLCLLLPPLCFPESQALGQSLTSQVEKQRPREARHDQAPGIPGVAGFTDHLGRLEGPRGRWPCPSVGTLPVRPGRGDGMQ